MIIYNYNINNDKTEITVYCPDGTVLTRALPEDDFIEEEQVGLALRDSILDYYNTNGIDANLIESLLNITIARFDGL